MKNRNKALKKCLDYGASVLNLSVYYFVPNIVGKSWKYQNRPILLSQKISGSQSIVSLFVMKLGYEHGILYEVFTLLLKVFTLLIAWELQWIFPPKNIRDFSEIR